MQRLLIRFFIVFRCRSGVREWAENKPVGTRTRASRASFTNQSALIGSTSCQGYTDSPLLSPFHLTLPLSIHPCLPTCSLAVSHFWLSLCCLFAPLPFTVLPFPSFLSVCNVEWWWIDMCWRTEEPIWTGVSAHLYQMLQRYILLLCFITLEWRALKCLTALSSLLRPPPPQLPFPPSPHLSPSHLGAVSCSIGAAEWVWALLSPSLRWLAERTERCLGGWGYRFHCMTETLTKPLPCLPILMTTSCHTGPPLAKLLPIKMTLTAPCFWAWPQNDITGKALN